MELVIGMDSKNIDEVCCETIVPPPYKKKL